MNKAKLIKRSEWAWEIPMTGSMLVPGLLYASESLIEELDDKVFEQLSNVAALPGIMRAAYAMPDAHWGYGFPIGGVAAFDPQAGGVISAGGVGFDISCGVRTLLTPYCYNDLQAVRDKLGDALFYHVPAGVGSTSRLRLNARDMTAMLTGGARWAVEQGYGMEGDVARIESQGRCEDADPAQVSKEARQRQVEEMGTLGAGNHYLEIQVVREIFDESIARAYGLVPEGVVVSIHCGSRGLGHQVATEFSRRMVIEASDYGINVRDRELASVPAYSPPGKSYYGAMRAAANCALANRQILSHFVREVFCSVLGEAPLNLLYDVSHNLCSLEDHEVEGKKKQLFVHRKGATRALGPGHSDLPGCYSQVGQPVLVGGTMGTASYILAGTAEGDQLGFSSACHGAGRSQSRSQALKQYRGEDVVEKLRRRNITIKTRSYRGVAEEAPAAYKDVSEVVRATAGAGLARLVARLEPMICVKG
ncbi:MAG: RtcB family protein [bacterium]|jgi:tRNA-splicing ligase RtcB